MKAKAVTPSLFLLRLMVIKVRTYVGGGGARIRYGCCPLSTREGIFDSLHPVCVFLRLAYLTNVTHTNPPPRTPTPQNQQLSTYNYIAIH